MKNLTIAILCFFFCSCNLRAQNQLKGKVLDANDSTPIAGATIYFPDLKKGTISMADGSYEIGQLPKGRFLVEYKFIGYASEIRRIDINGLTNHNAALYTKATELNEIVVTGISQSTELKSNPVPIITVNAQALLENTSTNLIDNISKQAGVNQITTGGAISKPVIRGLSYNRIITLYDGVRQEGQQWGDEHGIEIDEFSVERVEIVKGAGSLMYGSDGLGGVINFLAPDPVAQGTIKSKWTSNYQTNNGLIANSLYNAGNLKGLYWMVRLSNKNARPYENRFDGKVFNSGFNETDLGGYMGINRSWGYSQLAVSSFSQSVGLIEGERNGDGNFVYLRNNGGQEEEVIASSSDLRSYNLFIPRQSIDHLRISNSNNIYLKESRLQINMAYQNNKRREFGNVIDEHEKSLFFDLSTFNYNINLFLPEKSDRQISFGTGGMQQENKNRGREFLIPEYSLLDWGIYGFVKQHIKTLTVAGGVRYDLRKVGTDALYLDDNGYPTNASNATQKFEKSELTFSNVTASLGLTQKVAKQLTAKANVSRGYRAPNLAELSSNGKHEGSFRYEIGNYNLKAETSFQIDGALSFNADHIAAELSIFRNDINNYIFIEKLLTASGMDSIPDPEDPAVAYQYVQGNAVLSGGEFLLDIHPHPFDWLHFENSFSLVNAINKGRSEIDSSKYLPFIPAPRYQGELRANIKKTGKYCSGFFVKLEFDHFWKQDRVFLENGTESVTRSYSLWNAGMGTDVISGKKKLLFSFYVTVSNLMDRAYQNHLNRLKYAPENPVTGRGGVFNMGRNVSFKVVVPIVFRNEKG